MAVAKRAGLAVLATAILVASAPTGAAEPPTHVVVDMAGRSVRVPARIERVVTLGSLPVLNSFVFAMGQGATLVNGLADFAQPHWKFQLVFAPQIARLPAMQLPNREPNVEAILLARPDVVLTMHRAGVDLLARTGIPTIYLAWREPEDVKTCMTLLGEVFRRPEHAVRYRRYFDDTLARVRPALQPVPMSARPKVLYFHPATLTQPRLIAEWWIPAAGGISVTDDGRTAESRTFSLEQVVLWDPDILIVTGPNDVTLLRSDPTFRRLKAVQNGRIYVVPVGAHTWANRTAEQPLTVLWAAKTFHPERFATLDLAAETKAFYRDFFGYTASEAQIAEILSGTL